MYRIFVVLFALFLTANVFIKTVAARDLPYGRSVVVKHWFFPKSSRAAHTTSDYEERTGKMLSPLVVFGQGEGYPVCREFAALINAPKNDKYRLLTPSIYDDKGEYLLREPATLDVPKTFASVFAQPTTWLPVPKEQQDALLTPVTRDLMAEFKDVPFTKYNPWLRRTVDEEWLIEQAMADLDDDGKPEHLLRIRLPEWMAWVLQPSTQTPPYLRAMNSWKQVWFTSILTYHGHTYIAQVMGSGIALSNVVNIYSTRRDIPPSYKEGDPPDYSTQIRCWLAIPFRK